MSRFVALPEVGEHTDAVHIGELGLPVGFDLEQLQLNVDGLERVARWGNIGHVTLEGARGDISEYAYGVGSIDDSGVGSAVGSVAVTKADLFDIDFSSTNYPMGYNWKHVKVTINNSEIEERIRTDGDRWDLGVFDPSARAKYMNQAVRRGLLRSAKESVKADSDIKVTTGGVGSLFIPSVLGLPLELGPFLFISSQIMSRASWHAMQKEKYGDQLPPAQWSLIWGSYYDRLAMANLTARMTKLIRATPLSNGAVE